MDNMDIKILKSLRKNARLTASSISEEIGLSVSAVIERIKKLENSGIIKGYTIDVDQAKMGNTMVALMDVSLKHPDYYDGFVELVKENDSIEACYYQTGEFDFVLRIVTDNTEGLDNVYKVIKGYEGVANTETHIVLRTIKEETAIV
ncbi:MAG: Lrp/AsnC family transcriptional regulator [Eubacterium sp.]|nr:Lrp/AsnC family transcriptional regulator [Eubacterium sp.]